MSWYTYLLICYFAFNYYHATVTMTNGIERRERSGSPRVSSIVLVYIFNLAFGFLFAVYLFVSGFIHGIKTAMRNK